MNIQQAARHASPFGDTVTDPQFLEQANALLGESFDLLATGLNAAQLDTVMRELLGVYNFDGHEFLSGFYARYVLTRAYAPGANFPAEVDAARRAIAAVSAWSEAQRLDWEAKLFSAPANEEMVASQRFSRALENEGSGMVALLQATGRSTDDAMRQVTARLASEYCLQNPFGSPRLRQILSDFAASVRPVEVSAAIGIAAGLAKPGVLAGMLLQPPEAA